MDSDFLPRWAWKPVLIVTIVLAYIVAGALGCVFLWLIGKPKWK